MYLCLCNLCQSLCHPQGHLHLLTWALSAHTCLQNLNVSLRVILRTSILRLSCIFLYLDAGLAGVGTPVQLSWILQGLQEGRQFSVVHISGTEKGTRRVPLLIYSTLRGIPVVHTRPNHLSRAARFGVKCTLASKFKGDCYH